MTDLLSREEYAAIAKNIDMVSFTGSTETDRHFLRYAADSNLKKVVLECGGKNPAMVLDDAEELDLVAEHIVNAAFWNMDENCSANSRLIVHEAVKAPLVERILGRLRDWKTGHPLDPANHLGALIDDLHCKKVKGYLDGQSSDQNTNIKRLAGGAAKGNFIEPSVFDEVPATDILAKEEIFGPVLSISKCALNRSSHRSGQ